MTDVELSELQDRLGTVALVDVRSAEEYDGSLGAPCDARQGHIPGAVNVDVQEMSSLTVDELRRRLGVGETEGAEVIAYCHSGSRSAMAVHILRRLGYDARNYVGSWHEWSATDLPIE